jgi:hypothetical protein
MLRVLPRFCALQLKYRVKMTHDSLSFHPRVSEMGSDQGKHVMMDIIVGPSYSCIITAVGGFSSAAA